MSLGLAIDTTFDDTSVAIVSGKHKILANLTLSQYADHAEFGGVVPERASRKHLEVIHPLLEEAFAQSNLRPQQLDYIAVSNLPGLMGSLLVGITVAKALAFLLKKPLVGINHIEAHPYANFLIHGELPFPLLHLVVAGGHTLLIFQEDHFRWRIVGRSVDDAAGECVDKVAKLYGHDMPGGPVVDRMALQHPPGAYRFPTPMLHDQSLNFSFSGLKTALLYHQRDNPDLPAGPVLAAFFDSVVQVLTGKTLRAAEQLQPKAITLSGGLAASMKLRTEFARICGEAGWPLYVPPPALCTDNAAMVGCLGAYRFEAGLLDGMALEGFANLPM